MPLQLKPRQGPSPLPFTFDSPPPSPLVASGSDVTGVPRDAREGKLAPRPPADFIPERDMNMFGMYPLSGSGDLGRGLVKCARCQRPTMESAFAEHQRICAHILDGAPLTLKKTNKAEKTFKASDASKKRRISDASSDTPSPSKKRSKMPAGSHADHDGSSALYPHSFKGMKKSEIKKIQKEQLRIAKREAKEKEKMEIAERKRQKTTGPIDYDKHCGVINDKGFPCTRSLTCKTHTVGAKRAVEGRTRSYDELHLEWQRANNPNFKEPPSKQVRDARRAQKRAAMDGAQNSNSVNGSNNGGAPGLKKKKVKHTGGDDDDEGWGEGEEGQREMDDLIHCARMALENLKKWKGHRFHGESWFGMDAIVSQSPAPLPTPAVTPAAAAGAKGPNGAAAGNKPSQPVLPPRPPAKYRATSHEVFQVGDILTKALAARPRPTQQAQKQAGPGGVPPPKVANGSANQAQTLRMMIPPNMAAGGSGTGMMPSQQQMAQKQFAMAS